MCGNDPSTHPASRTPLFTLSLPPPRLACAPGPVRQPSTSPTSGSPCVSPCMPSGPRVDLLAPAATAAQPLTHLRDHQGFHQGVHVHVSLMVTCFTLCPDHPHAVLAHVREGHRWPLRRSEGHDACAFGNKGASYRGTKRERKPPWAVTLPRTG
jgi:hypothetical protein